MTAIAAAGPRGHVAPAAMPLVASEPVLFLDWFRVPYRVDAVARGAAAPSLAAVAGASGAALYWPRRPHRAVPPAMLGGLPLWTEVAPEGELGRLRQALGGRWTPVWRVAPAGGGPPSAIWRAGDGSVLLPFDPDAAIMAMLSERYRDAAGGRRALAGARGAYYAARPLLPRRTQLAMRRAFSRRQARTTFPRWPFEPALHDLLDRLLRLAACVAGGSLPTLAPWPDGRDWALVLTHDVELAAGRDAVHVLRDVEESLGLRSSWNFVPERYADVPALREDLAERGFEVGLHGLRHDGRDLAPRTFARRLPAMRSYARAWGVSGFRSPATHRDWALLPRLGVDYDSSYTDTAPFEPQPGGCCSWLPYFNGAQVELPITLLQDHTLFEILGERDERVWVDKAARLRERGGMVLALTHPDYMLAPERVAAYRRFLGPHAADEAAWHALPREVSAWWRRRAASVPAWRAGRWQVEGPAAGEARVEIVESEEEMAV